MDYPQVYGKSPGFRKPRSSIFWEKTCKEIYGKSPETIPAIHGIVVKLGTIQIKSTDEQYEQQLAASVKINPATERDGSYRSILCDSKLMATGDAHFWEIRLSRLSDVRGITTARKSCQYSVPKRIPRFIILYIYHIYIYISYIYIIYIYIIYIYIYHIYIYIIYICILILCWNNHQK